MFMSGCFRGIGSKSGRLSTTSLEDFGFVPWIDGACVTGCLHLARGFEWRSSWVVASRPHLGCCLFMWIKGALALHL
ncbi:hypothetical protein KC19_6G051800 [Ceratodon purpureus]|uniref:Uncharacterized protein n=1 Tax=Ceratodon purpureus TaxID=3225 RepID=A0A8T0HFR1_CERPU|nr:hypothetical protein KC19_6G051800 [Ceratodon purpureus]